MLELKEREDFERRFKGVFYKTLELGTYYTGINFDVSFGRFEYHDINNELAVALKISEILNGRLLVFPQIKRPIHKFDSYLTNDHFSLIAAHEAGELIYNLTRRNLSRKHYRIKEETIGDYFYRLFCKKHNIIPPFPKDNSPYKILYSQYIESLMKWLIKLKSFPSKNRL